jgi:hypothetical protein
VSVCVTTPIVSRQRLSKHVLAVSNTHASTAELFEAAFTVRCLSYLILSKLCKESRRLHLFHPSGEKFVSHYIIVMNMTIVRQWFCRHCLKARIATNRIVRSLIDNDALSAFSVTTTWQETFPWLRARLYKEPRREERVSDNSFIRESNGSVSSDSSFVIHCSRGEDTRGPVLNGASIRQSLIVSSYNWL